MPALASASPASRELVALRRAAVDHAFGPMGDLASVMDRTGFVQADPIRAPARAQDLILRQRVTGYRAGDLERAYPRLPLFEDMIHVYGFVHSKHRSLLHPRRIARRFQIEDEHPHLRREILDHLAREGPSHPRAIDQAIARRHPRAAIINAWGGQSSATTRMLEVLHYRGLLDVVRRERGIRVYGSASSRYASRDTHPPRRTPQQRADGLIELLVALYAPLPVGSLTQLTYLLGERAMPRDALRARIPALIRRGTLRDARVGGVHWIRPAVDPLPVVSTPIVRFLAPFDPLVWDRRRFSLLWRWDYRFEAYTPLARRQLGYYALPLLWDDGDDARIVGWVNATRRGDGPVAVDAGFVDGRPRPVAFRAAFDAEADRLARFLAADPCIEDEARPP